MSDDKIVKPDQSLAKRTSLFAAKKVGIQKHLEQHKEVALDPREMENRIGIIGDDSGSMGGQKLIDAKKGISSFLKACGQGTSVALYCFHKARRWGLTADLFILDQLKDSIEADQSTPLFTTMEAMLEKENLTRAVIFSDGEATDGSMDSITSRNIVEQYKARGIMVDCVFIYNARDGVEVDNRNLQMIAEMTGGLYIKFKDSELFAQNFKYLTPAFRAYLTDGNFRKQIGAE